MLPEIPAGLPEAVRNIDEFVYENKVPAFNNPKTTVSMLDKKC